MGVLKNSKNAKKKCVNYPRYSTTENINFSLMELIFVLFSRPVTEQQIVFDLNLIQTSTFKPEGSYLTKGIST